VNEGIKVRTRQVWQSGGTEVQILQGDKVMVATLVDRLPAGEPVVITIGQEIGDEFLRACMNAAWEIGMRPDGYHDVRENMKATDAHLQDMRALAFGKLGVEKPK
jgi:hypothetical protein